MIVTTGASNTPVWMGRGGGGGGGVCGVCVDVCVGGVGGVVCVCVWGGGGGGGGRGVRVWYSGIQCKHTMKALKMTDTDLT